MGVRVQRGKVGLGYRELRVEPRRKCATKVELGKFCL